ncbi:hypothetical protein ACIP5Y_18725 [Nocardia sp. NPDC088792]|uniref:hypothetical protein n=1 Tax=Nocardia sp. NPDC088792 TaxID=3364332 RepID=UPI0037FC1DD9
MAWALGGASRHPCRNSGLVVEIEVLHPSENLRQVFGGFNGIQAGMRESTEIVRRQGDPPMGRAQTITDTSSALPETLLDGVDWPGLVLLAAGVAALAWTITGSSSGPGFRLVGGAVATAITLITGFVWITVEHKRFGDDRKEPSES